MIIAMPFIPAFETPTTNAAVMAKTHEKRDMFDSIDRSTVVI
ncbi:hypothetical protein FB2170_06230 [Maribacter sp. HTCC2170]|nr:hypothetical protein FB2170_06230 [Maribacter sp. HTCC2170]